MPEYFYDLAGVHISQHRLPVVPSHIYAFAVVNEIIQIQAALVLFSMDDVSDLFCEPGLPVGRQPHHLVLVSVLREAEELRERGIENAERMRKRHAAPDSDIAAVPEAPGCGGEVAGAIDAVHISALDKPATVCTDSMAVGQVQPIPGTAP